MQTLFFNSEIYTCCHRKKMPSVYQNLPRTYEVFYTKYLRGNTRYFTRDVSKEDIAFSVNYPVIQSFAENYYLHSCKYAVIVPQLIFRSFSTFFLWNNTYCNIHLKFYTKINTFTRCLCL